jgi:beta-lactamase superfamily II metal-dependent hydrolase
MTEIDFLAVGESGNSGDAIAVRTSNPETGYTAILVIDAGFKGDGSKLAEHIRLYYETDVVDLAILTHPDGDHIGGMGEVLRELNVQRLWLHDIGAHGGASLPAAAAVRELIKLAGEQDTLVEEAWTGASALGGAVQILGPTKAYYEQLVREQLGEDGSAIAKGAGRLIEAARGVFERLGDSLGIETPFDPKPVTPRNNSSLITALIDGTTVNLFTGDAGVPALEAAMDQAEATGITFPPGFVQIPHHGSRRNASSDALDRLLGPTGQATGSRTAFVSAARESEKHPSGKVVNAYSRRGCDVVVTAGRTICHGSWVNRSGWTPVPPLPPMDESEED